MINKLITGYEKKESTLLIERAFEFSLALEIDRLLIQVNRLSDLKKIAKIRTTQKIAWITMEEFDLPKELKRKDILIHVPKSPLTRISQMRIGLFLSVTQGFVSPENSVMGLSGEYASKRIDTLTILNANRDFPWYQRQAKTLFKLGLPMRTLERAIYCALRLATEGREGRPIGSILVIGEISELQPHTRQLILNPLEGHPKRVRNLDSPEFFETLRELSGLDGAFLISPNGTVESAGTYLGAQSHVSLKLLPGLGARHAAAAALTNHCKSAIAVVLSESSGTVSVLHGGSIILKLEKVATFPQA